MGWNFRDRGHPAAERRSYRLRPSSPRAVSHPTETAEQESAVAVTNSQVNLQVQNGFYLIVSPGLPEPGNLYPTDVMLSSISQINCFDSSRTCFKKCTSMCVWNTSS